MYPVEKGGVVKDNKKILNIGSGVWQLPFINACCDLGYGIIAVDLDPEAPGFRLADHVINLSAHDPDPIYQALTDSNFDLQSIAAVLTTASRGCITTAANLAERLGVAGPALPVDAANILVDRHLFRDFLVENKLPVPQYRIITDAEQAEDVDLPVVVKSIINTSGSDGITLVDRTADLPMAVSRAQKAGKVKPVIVESFISGRDIGVLGVFHRGELIFSGVIERHVNEAPHFLPQSYNAPARLSEQAFSRLDQVHARLGQNLNITSGPFYVEYRLDDTNTPYAIEGEPTVPAHIGYLLSESMGVDVYDLVVRSLLDRIDSLSINKVRGSAGCRFVYASSAGIISRITPPDTGNGALIVRKAVGDEVKNISAADICGVLYASGRSELDVRQTLDRWENQFIVETVEKGMEN